MKSMLHFLRCSKLNLKNNMLHFNKYSCTHKWVPANYGWVIFISQVVVGRNKYFYLSIVPYWSLLKQHKLCYLFILQYFSDNKSFYNEKLSLNWVLEIAEFEPRTSQSRANSANQPCTANFNRAMAATSLEIDKLPSVWTVIRNSCNFWGGYFCYLTPTASLTHWLFGSLLRYCSFQWKILMLLNDSVELWRHHYHESNTMLTLTSCWLSAYFEDTGRFSLIQMSYEQQRLTW